MSLKERKETEYPPQNVPLDQVAARISTAPPKGQPEVSLLGWNDLSLKEKAIVEAIVYGEHFEAIGFFAAETKSIERMLCFLHAACDQHDRSLTSKVAPLIARMFAQTDKFDSKTKTNRTLIETNEAWALINARRDLLEIAGELQQAEMQFATHPPSPFTEAEKEKAEALTHEHYTIQLWTTGANANMFDELGRGVFNQSGEAVLNEGPIVVFARYIDGHIVVRVDRRDVRQPFSKEMFNFYINGEKAHATTTSGHNPLVNPWLIDFVVEKDAT